MIQKLGVFLDKIIGEQMVINFPRFVHIYFNDDSGLCETQWSFALILIDEQFFNVEIDRGLQAGHSAELKVSREYRVSYTNDSNKMGQNDES